MSLLCTNCESRSLHTTTERRRGLCKECCEANPLPTGRPRIYTDEEIVYLVNQGIDSTDELLDALGARHKTTLIRRLRTLDAEGRISLVERKRHEGFLVLPEGTER